MVHSQTQKQLSVEDYRRIAQELPQSLIEAAMRFNQHMENEAIPKKYVRHPWANQRLLIEVCWNPLTYQWLMKEGAGKDEYHFSRMAKALAFAVRDKLEAQLGDK
jgi:uracil DNA glycosylase